MAEKHLVVLDSNDFKLVGKIMKNAKSCSTPEAAVKWALKECAARWEGTTPVGLVWEEKMAVPPVVHSVVSSPPRDRIPLGIHHLGVVKLPLRDLAGLSHSVLVGSKTLERLVPDRAERANILAGATLGRIKI